LQKKEKQAIAVKKKAAEDLLPLCNTNIYELKLVYVLK